MRSRWLGRWRVRRCQFRCLCRCGCAPRNSRRCSGREGRVRRERCIRGQWCVRWQRNRKWDGRALRLPASYSERYHHDRRETDCVHAEAPSWTDCKFINAVSFPCRPGFPILGVFRLKGQPNRDGGMIFRSCKASQTPVYPIRDAILAVNHAFCPSLSSSGPPPMG